jgi:hypothetical protein
VSFSCRKLRHKIWRESLRARRNLPQEEGQHMALTAASSGLEIKPCTKAMGQAIGLAIILVVIGIFMPDVLHALSTFLLALFSKATAFVNNLPTSPAMINAQPLINR